jgi:ketosteroid isomerase-like protein
MMENFESQELEIEQANADFYQAFESLDIREMERIWAKDQPVRCIHPGWGVRAGWPAVRDSWILIFNNTSSVRLDVTNVDVRMKGEVGWVTCTENLTTTIDGEIQASRVHATNIFIRRAGHWLMTHHHGSPVFDMPAGEAVEPD